MLVSGLTVKANLGIANYLLNIHFYNIDWMHLFSVLWERILGGVMSREGNELEFI